MSALNWAAYGVTSGPWFTRHRGPFRLMVVRALTTKPGFRSEWLSGSGLDGEDVEAEAKALLSDKRDRILAVHVWSIREEQFVESFKKGGKA